MALQQLTFIRDTTNRGSKEGFASPMNPEVGKILWHLSLFGSEIKIIIIIILIGQGHYSDPISRTLK
jgi:hypothetical protein